MPIQPAKELPDFEHGTCADSDTMPQELGFAFMPHVAQHDRVLSALSHGDGDMRRVSLSSSSHDHVSHMENVQKSSRAISAAQLRWRSAPKSVLVILKKVCCSDVIPLTRSVDVSDLEFSRHFSL